MSPDPIQPIIAAVSWPGVGHVAVTSIASATSAAAARDAADLDEAAAARDLTRGLWALRTSRRCPPLLKGEAVTSEDGMVSAFEPVW